MIETFMYEWSLRHQHIKQLLEEDRIVSHEFYQLAIKELEILRKIEPSNITYISQQAEFFHLNGHLREAGKLYQHVLAESPLLSLADKEVQLIYKFCPILLTQETEPFLLRDIVAIHHPSKPLIGYHLFWEDDFDFPDDYEPSDHEEVWVEYNVNTETITNVSCWFHSRIIESEAAVLEAHENNQRPIIRIEWGKHGSLLNGWESIKDPYSNITIYEWLQETYKHVKKGGRVPSHPLKRFWPAKFEGTFEEYVTFSVDIDPLSGLKIKPLMFKTEWVNATLFTQALLYNFHPKMGWPDRFYSHNK